MEFFAANDRALMFLDDGEVLAWVAAEGKLEMKLLRDEKKAVANERRRIRHRLKQLQAKGLGLGLKAWGVLDSTVLTAQECLTFEKMVLKARSFSRVVNPTQDDTKAGWRVECPEKSASVVIDAEIAKHLLTLCLGNPQKLDRLLEMHLRFRWSLSRLSQISHLSAVGMASLINGVAWLESRRPLLISKMTPATLRAIGRTSEPLRWALVEGITAGKKDKAIVLKQLGWALAQQARKNPALRLSTMPPAEQWRQLFGFAAAKSLVMTDLAGFKVKVFRALCPVMGLSLSESGLAHVGNTQPLFNLVRLFGEEQAIRRFVKDSGCDWSEKGLHDAGQFTLPKKPGWTPSKWVALCLKIPQAVQYAQEFANLEKAGVFPDSLAKLRREILLRGYPDVEPGYEKLAEVCLEAKLTGEDFKAHQSFWKNIERKTAEFLPQVDVQGEELGLAPGWRFMKLDAFDYRGPMLGQLTGCCQHLRGAGSASAVHGVTSPYSAFYVVTHHGKVIAQTWAWLTQKRGVVFDSLESLVRGTTDLIPVFQLVQEGARRMVQSPFGIDNVCMGNTHSGVTWQALAYLFEDKGVPADLHTEPVDGGGYYDGLAHILIAGKVSRRKSKVPEVDGYPREKFKKPGDFLFEQDIPEHILDMVAGRRRLRGLFETDEEFVEALRVWEDENLQPH